MELLLEEIESARHKRQLISALAVAEDIEVDSLVKIVHTIAFEQHYKDISLSQKKALSVYMGKTYKLMRKSSRRVKVSNLLSLGITLQKVISSNIDKKWLKMNFLCLKH